MKKSIVMIASYGGPYAGNFIPSLIAYDNVVKELNYRTVYIFPEFVKDKAWVEMMEDVADKLYFIPYNPYSYDNVNMIRKICKSEKACIIYSRMSGWDITAKIAMPFTPIIWHMEMELDLTSRKQWLKYFIKYKIFGAGRTYHISISKKTADEINSYGVKNACLWIPNAISLERLDSKASNAFHNPIRLLTFAYRPFIKGFDLALDACEILNKERIAYELIASSQVDTYEYIHNRYGTEPPKWLILKQPTDNINELYNKADILLSPSRSEGFSYCLAEALFSGLPVVYSDVPGTSWADEMQMVYRFKTGDIHDLAEKIKKCSDTPVSDEAKLFNRELIRTKYTLPAWANEIKRYIIEVK